VPGIIFEKLGFRYFGPVDGHDISSLSRVFGQLRKLSGPRLVHVITKKGKGYTPAEKDDLRFHGVSGLDRMTGKPASGKKMSYTDVFGETMVRVAAADSRIVAVTPAMLAGSGLLAMRRKFPDRVFDVGIAEGHAGTFSAGLAASGLKPVFAVYSTFLQRAFDQMVHDIGLQKLPVLVCIDRGGLVGEDGPTHHGSFDISYLRTIPHLTICAPRNGSELAAMMFHAAENLTGPIAIRYPRGTIPEDRIDSSYSIDWGKWEILRESHHAMFLAVGSMVERALGAAEILAEEGIEVGVANCRFIKPLDEECLIRIARECDVMITAEENSLIGGFGEGVLDCLNRRDTLNGKKVLSLGLPDRFVDHGDTPRLLRDLKLDAEGLADKAREFIRPKSTPSERCGSLAFVRRSDSAKSDAELNLRET
jgi:1-deoxy-D-xylulose-5-phosphate synthase